MTLMVVFGVRLSFTVFFVALIEEFGWSRADTALIFSTSMVIFAATSTFTGMALDKWGARLTFGIGAALLTLGLLFSSGIQNIAQLAVSYGAIAGLGITILGLGPQASLIARWFKRRRGMAIGIAFAGTGIGMLIFTPGTEYLVDLFGWRTAYVILAGMTFSTIPLIAIFLRQNPSDIELLQDGASTVDSTETRIQTTKEWIMRNVVRTPSFWFLMVAAIGAIGPVRMLTVHQLAILVETGFERSFAAAAVGLSGGIASIAFIGLGAISDKVDRRLIYLFGSFCLVSALLILGNLHSPDQNALLFAYVVFLGLGEGSRSSLVTAVASDLFPGDALGAINGAVGAAFGTGAALFPWLAGMLYDQRGSYSTAFIIMISAVVVSTLSLWLAPLILPLEQAQ